MILNIYNIRDERVGTFGTPIFTQFDESQVADNYAKSVETLNAKVARIQKELPEQAAQAVMEAAALKDCVVYKVGTFDDKTGSFVIEDPLLVCRLSDYFQEVI